MDLKAEITSLCKDKDLTIKELSERAAVSEKGLHNKFKRGNMTVQDLEHILSVLGKRLAIVDK